MQGLPKLPDTMKKYEILCAYFYAEQCRLEAEISDIQDRVRYRRITTVDCIELILASERLSALLEFSSQVKAILKI